MIDVLICLISDVMVFHISLVSSCEMCAQHGLPSAAGALLIAANSAELVVTVQATLMDSIQWHLEI